MTWYVANEEGIALGWIQEPHLSLSPHHRTLSLKAQSWGRTCQIIFPIALEVLYLCLQVGFVMLFVVYGIDMLARLWHCFLYRK